MKPLSELVRPNILALSPYSCARDEFKGVARVLLDANESPYNSPINRYPDPLQRHLKELIAPVKGVAPENIFLGGGGSDEAIDLCYRVFCRPSRDNVVAIEPTYGMYRVEADINEAEYRPVKLSADFRLDASAVLAATDDDTKLILLCSPNNPTGNALDFGEMEKIVRSFPGIVVIDEAYSDFSSKPIFRTELGKYSNIIVLNTFSKAWGSAGIRLGMAFARKEIIDIFNKVKYPYNVNVLTAAKGEEMISRRFEVNKWVNMILSERVSLMDAVSQLPYCEKVYPTDANFFLARFSDATALYSYLAAEGIVVRNRSNVTLCNSCLRITVGSREENSILLAAMRKYNIK